MFALTHPDKIDKLIDFLLIRTCEKDHSTIGKRSVDTRLVNNNNSCSDYYYCTDLFAALNDLTEVELAFRFRRNQIDQSDSSRSSDLK